MDSDHRQRDEALAQAIESWKRGDPEGFAAIYSQLFALVRDVAHVRLGGALRITSDSGDIVQDVFLSLLRAPPPEGVVRAAELQAYLTEAVLNRLRDLQRHEHRQKRDRDRMVSPADRSAVLARVARVEPTPSEISMGREKYARFLDQLARLPERERDAILCAKIEGRSSEDAAARLGFDNAGAFRAFLSRALSRLSLAIEQRAGP